MGWAYAKRHHEVIQPMIKFLKRLKGKILCPHINITYIGMDSIRKWYKCNDCGSEFTG